MTLKKLREKWEKGLIENLCVITIHDEVLVILEDDLLENIDLDVKYYFHRYFKIGDNWEISVDYKGEDEYVAMKLVSSYFEKWLAELGE